MIDIQEDQPYLYLDPEAAGYGLGVARHLTVIPIPLDNNPRFIIGASVLFLYYESHIHRLLRLPQNHIRERLEKSYDLEG